MKNIIDVYPNRILDLDLVVITNPNIKQIQSRYTYTNGDPIRDDLLGSNVGMAAVFLDKKTKVDVLVVMLICIPEHMQDKSELEQSCYMINTIGHECLHVLLDTFDIINDVISSKSQEMPAYYMGWLVECVYRTWIKSNDTLQKRKKTKG